MTLTVDITEEFETKLETEAERNGVSKNEFVKIVLEEKLDLQKPAPRKPLPEAKIIATDLPVRDFSREHEWVKENREKYQGQWVALDGGELIAADADGKKFGKKVRDLKLNGLFIVFIEEKDRPPFISGGIW